MHLHLASPPEPELYDGFVASLPSGVTLTTGDPVPDTTEVLVDGHPAPGSLKPLPALKGLVIPFAGLTPRTREEALTRPDVKVYNLHHNASATAEKAMELLLAVAKLTVPNDNSLRNGPWCPRFDSSEAVLLEGKTAVVFGFGEIGQRVGRACLAFGMKVVGVSRTGALVEGFRTVAFADWHGLAQGCDALIVCSPLTPETKGAIGPDVVRDLPAGAMVVNVGRGAVIDEDALYEALASGRLHGAGLDVWWHYPSTEPECHPSRRPYHELPNVVLSPHVGGTVKETETARLRALADLVTRIHRSDPLLKPVDVERGY